MAGPSLSEKLSLAFAVALVVWACSGGGKPKAVTPPSTEPQDDPVSQKIQEAEEKERAERAADPTVPEATPADEEEDSSVIFVEAPGEPEARQETLWEASQRERERRAQTRSGPSSIVINDENLQEYASQGELTVAAPNPNQPPAEQQEAGPAEEEGGEEEYWRTTVRDARLRWRSAADSIGELEDRVAELRYEFYATDDGYYRDTQVKPRWDRAIDQLERARFEVDAAQRDLELLLEEGRRAGALPGWLREGSDLEPQFDETEEEPRHEVIEPPVFDESDDGSALR